MNTGSLCSIFVVATSSLLLACKNSQANPPKDDHCQQECSRAEVQVAELLDRDENFVCLTTLVSPHTAIVSAQCLGSRGEKTDRKAPEWAQQFKLKMGDRSFAITENSWILAHEYALNSAGLPVSLLSGAPVALLSFHGEVPDVGSVIFAERHPLLDEVFKSSYETRTTPEALRLLVQDQFLTGVDSFYYRGTLPDEGGVEHFGTTSSMPSLCPLSRQSGIFIKHRNLENRWELLAIPLMPYSKDKECMDSDGAMYLRLSKNEAAARLLNKIQEWEN